MFRENHRYEQGNFFNTVEHLPRWVKKMMDKSWAPGFRELVFRKIDERRYTELYSDVDSRPNFPVNVWVGLEIIKGMFDYTDEELLEQFHFNLLTAYALGLENLGEVTLAERTIYYNRKRLLEYEAQTGRNLLEEEFQAMTDDALEELGINAKTQRMDSSFVGSFIKQMSRLELIVKVLQNFYRDLDGKEQARWNPLVKEYVETEARHIAYYLKSAEVGYYLQRVGALLFELHQTYAGDERINALKSYEHIGRVLLEQFNIVEGGKETQIEVKPSQEISARSLQNPADDTATCRTKDGRIYKGGMFNVAETCAPENKVQLLTDVCVEQNVVADDDFLAERLPTVKERTGVEEIVTDANYTGEHSERVCQEETVAIIPTEVKGHKEQADRLSLKDFHFDGNSIASCPEGYSPIEQVHKPESGRHVVRFAKAICGACPRANECPARCRKYFYSLAFSDRQALLARRRQQLSQEDYRSKCRLRPAIEGTISQFKQKMRNGKLRIRGLPRIRNSIILMAIGINFGRVWAYLLETNPSIAFFSAVVVILALVLAIMVTRQPTYSDFKLCRTISR
jgi:hypothetical protein